MMKMRKLFLLTIMLVVGLALPGSYGTDTKTLKRVHDPVVMECKKLGALNGSPIDSLGDRKSVV